MSPTPGRSPLKPDELAAIFNVDDDPLRELEALDTSARTGRSRRPARRVSLADRVGRIPKWVYLIAGVLIGWLVIGWWLWPVRWTNSDPWEMSAKNQQNFVQLVADRYWYDRDLTQAENTLNGWDRAEVNSLLVALQAETIDAAARDHLDALSQALSLPGGQQSLLASIFSQEGIIFALAIAALPMFIAIGLVVATRLSARSVSAKGEAGAEDQEADLEELLADVQLDEGMIGGGPGPEGAVAGAEPGQENKPDEKQPGQEEEEKEEEEEDEETIDANNPLGDLASLFAEEDTSLASLEALCKGMPELVIDDMLNTARNILRRFKEERRKN